MWNITLSPHKNIDHHVSVPKKPENTYMLTALITQCKFIQHYTHTTCQTVQPHTYFNTGFSGQQDVYAVPLLTETDRQVTFPCIWLLSKLKQRALGSQPTQKCTWGFTDTSWNYIVNMTSKQVAFSKHRSWPNPLTLLMSKMKITKVKWLFSIYLQFRKSIQSFIIEPILLILKAEDRISPFWTIS